MNYLIEKEENGIKEYKEEIWSYEDYWETFVKYLGYNLNDIDTENSDNSRTYFKDGHYARIYNIDYCEGKNIFTNKEGVKSTLDIVIITYTMFKE